MPPIVGALVAVVIVLVALAIVMQGRPAENVPTVALPAPSGGPSSVASPAGSSELAPCIPPAPYATFPRRLNALTADGVLIVSISIVLLVLSSFAEPIPALQRSVGLVWVSVLVLYDPLMVAFYGGTLGHRLLNLRVIDDRTGGNLGLGTAIVRHWVKVLLGALSFISMSFSRRHLALHDMMTHSSVQIRDLARAQRHHYVWAPELRPPPAAT
jgi:uncharacterized RDD family membrane protein YckC